MQDLFDSHVAVPVFHSGDLFLDDLTGFGVHAGHVDFGDEFENGRDRRIIAGAVDSQLVKSVVVIRLRVSYKKLEIDKARSENNSKNKFVSAFATIDSSE